ncbi:MAG: hypothetical protein G01um1014106_98 [Parcubacteria group bacterium Gr01-1014_106]|nr:MAG: hypothetical protein G01um1014106_98 [Parcubacteria group bacterium Gr01-1014_106]
MIFPYRPYEVQPTPWFPEGIVYRPTIPVRVASAGRDTTVVSLVDTGADETVLPDFLVSYLGIETDTRKEATFRGIGGQPVHGVFGDVTLELQEGQRSYRWETTVAFISGPTVAVLGRHGFLDHFRATFDDVQRKLHLQFYHKPRRRRRSKTGMPDRPV